MASFKGVLVNNTGTNIKPFEHILRKGVLDGDLPDEILRVFDVRVVVVSSGEVRVIIDWKVDNE